VMGVTVEAATAAARANRVARCILDAESDEHSRRVDEEMRRRSQADSVSE
jgi:hypothetical protein